MRTTGIVTTNQAQHKDTRLHEIGYIYTFNGTR